MSMLHYHIRISISESLKQLSDFFCIQIQPRRKFPKFNSVFCVLAEDFYAGLLISEEISDYCTRNLIKIGSIRRYRKLVFLENQEFQKRRRYYFGL